MTNERTTNPENRAAADSLAIERGDVRLRRWLARLADEIGRAAARRERAELSLLEWGRRYLPDHFSLPPSAMHRWLEQRLERMGRVRGAKLNAIGPRGSAKSTVVSLAWPLRLAVERREPYIWIVSDSRQQAHAHLENVKAELEANPRLAADYADAAGKGPVWRAGLARLANGVAIEALGAGQRIRGRRFGAHRPSLIICDDLEDDRHMESAALRERSRRWFHGALLRAGDQRTNVVNLATALHRDALALRLHAAPGWQSRIFRAIEKWPTNMPLWAEWEAIYADADRPDRAAAALEFYNARREPMDAGAELLWPASEDLYALMRIRAESGAAAFEREKQGSPVNPESCEWPAEYFGAHLWFDDWPATCRVRVVALDPSKGADARRGEYSAFVMLAVEGDGRMLVEADMARRPLAQIIDDGVACCQRFGPVLLGVESNQHQELLGDRFVAALAKAGLIGVGVTPIETRVNKRVRIRRLGPLLAKRRLRFRHRSPSTALLVEQLQSFPIGDHDDGPDALEMALTLAERLLAGQNSDGLGGRLIVDP